VPTISKIFKLALPLGMALGMNAVGAQQTNFFDFFEEEFSPSYDIVLRKLDYTKQDQVAVPSGLFSFSRFKMIGDSVSVNLDNSDGYFDSQIYVAKNLVGFQGPLAQFAYRLKPEDFKYLESFEWLKLDHLEFKMDRSLIHLQGQRFTMQEPRTFLLAQNFNMDCDRHPDYLLNDGDGFLAGCLNSSVVAPLNSAGFDIDYKLRNAEGAGYLAQLSGRFTHFSGHQDHFSLKADRIDSIIQQETQIQAEDITVSCAKNEDLIKIGQEELLYPCLQDIKLKTKSITLDLTADEEEEGSQDSKITLLKPDFTHDQEGIAITTDFFDFRTDTLSFKTNAARINCDQANGLPDDMGSYFQSCLETAQISSKEKTKIDMEFTIDEPKTEEAEAFFLNLTGGISALNMENERVTLKSPQFNLNIDKDLHININDVNVNCNKKTGLREFDVDTLLTQCKDDAQINIDYADVFHNVNPEDPMLFTIVPQQITSTDTRVSGTISDMTMLTIKSVKFFENLKVDCQKMPEADLFKIQDVLEGCAHNGVITLDKLYSNEQDTKLSVFKEGVTLRNVRNTIKKAGVTDVKASIRNGYISVELITRVMGMKRSVSFSGPVSFDKEEKLLTIRVKDLKLPFLPDTKGFFRMAIRNLVEGETVTVNKATEIKVQL